jgi:hypothetical protein
MVPAMSQKLADTSVYQNGAYTTSDPPAKWPASSLRPHLEVTCRLLEQDEQSARKISPWPTLQFRSPRLLSRDSSAGTPCL